VKRLVVSSDDFGMCHSVNAGVLRGFREGILTQSTLMAPAPWLDEAVAMAKAHDIPVGVHLVAACDWDLYRWRPLTAAKSITAPDGTFIDSIQEVRRRGDPAEVEAEFAAQIESVIAKGIQPTHLDSHMWLVSADILAGLCRRFGIPTRNIAMDDLGERHPDVVFRFGSPVWGPSEEPDKTAALLAWLDGLGDGDHLMVVHAGQASDELASMASRDHPAWVWTQPYRQTDLDLILDPRVRRRIDEGGFELISLRDVPHALPAR